MKTTTSFPSIRSRSSRPINGAQQTHCNVVYFVITISTGVRVIGRMGMFEFACCLCLTTLLELFAFQLVAPKRRMHEAKMGSYTDEKLWETSPRACPGLGPQKAQPICARGGSPLQITPPPASSAAGVSARSTQSLPRTLISLLTNRSYTTNKSQPS